MKARHILGLAVLMAVAGSCKKNQNQDTNSFSASIEVDESRTYLDGMKVKWTSGDQIIVYGDGAPKTYTLSTGDGTQTATFTTTGGVQPTNTYRAFYPASSCRGVSDDVFTFSMPATQTYTANGFMNNLNPMAAKNDGNGGTTLGFKNAFAVAKFSTKGNCSVSKIELEVPSGKYVSGTFTFDFANGTTTHSSGGTQIITLNCTSPVDLNSTTANDFYFVLPPGSIDNGFTIRYYQPNSNTPFATKTVAAGTQGIALARNTIKTFQTTAEAQVQYVTNLLPELDIYGQNWTVSRHILKNFNYDNSHYQYESLKPSGNTWVIETASIYFSQSQNQNVTCNEGFIYTANGHHPQLTVGHTYYISWLSRTETEQGKSITQEVFWPERAWHVIPVSNTQYVTSNTVLWKKNSYMFTLSQGIWIEDPQLGPVVDGLHKIRFDINNGGNNIRHFCFADPILIDLTADYTNQGRPIPEKATLDGKAYFFGQRDIDTW